MKTLILKISEIYKPICKVFMYFLLLGGLLVFLCGCGQVESDDGQVNAKPVIAKILHKETIRDEIIYHSLLKPDEEVVVGFELGGKIARLNYNVGEVVTIGETLALLEDNQMQLNITRAEYQVETARANLELANLKLKEIEEDYQRKKHLYENGAIAKSAFESIENQLRSSQIQVEQAQTQLNTAELARQDNLLSHAKSILRSPINGVVIDKLGKEQQLIGSGQGVYLLGKIDQLKLEIDIPIAEKEQWPLGRSAEVHNRGEIRSAKVMHISPVATDITGKVKITLLVDNSSRDWLVGEMAEVRDIKPAREGFFLPPAAIMHKQTPYVFVIGDEDRVIEQPIELGLPAANQIEVFGLAEGSRVVIGGMERLLQNDQVRVIEEG
jgi:RND family efflux transporter MFP subunit